MRDSLREIYRKGGVSGLWHGTSAGVMKTVPKYCVAVTVKVRSIDAAGRVCIRDGMTCSLSASSRIWEAPETSSPKVAGLFLWKVLSCPSGRMRYSPARYNSSSALPKEASLPPGSGVSTDWYRLALGLFLAQRRPTPRVPRHRFV